MSHARISGLDDDPLSGLDPADPYPIYVELRARAPIYWSFAFNSWVVTRYDDVRTVVGDGAFRVLDPATRLMRLADRGGPRFENLILIYGSLALLADPERSRAPKRVFFQLLAGWQQGTLREQLAARARALLAAGAAVGGIDLASGFGRNLATFTSWALFGISADEHEPLSASLGISTLLSAAVHSLRDLGRLEVHAKAYVECFVAALDQRRRSAGDDGLSRMISAATAELTWTDEQLAGFCAFILGASREATAAGISGACLRLLEDDPLRKRLSASPEKRLAATRELLRLVSPVQFVSRTAIADASLAGQPIRAGQTVRAIVAAANRDPAVFPDPDSVDLDRVGPEPLTFSAGPFRCLGEHLAQMEVSVAIEALLDFPGIGLADEPATWGKSMPTRDLRRVPAEFKQADGSRG